MRNERHLLTSLAHRTPALAATLLLAWGASACDDAASAEEERTPADQLPDETTPYSIAFEARLGGEAFACDRTFDGVGTSGATVQPLDLRAFVHGFETRDANGAWVPLDVEDVPNWQALGVALLDFASPDAGCPNAGAGLRSEVSVRGAVDAIDGLRFVLGVPFEHNHANPTAAPAPLSGTAMHWSWQGGYKFLRLDLRHVDGEPWVVHLGSTGCEGTMTNIEGCAAENRVTIELEDWTPSAGSVVLDLDALLADSDVTFNTPETATGCMSAPSDPECDAIFAALGLGEPGAGLAPVLFRAP